MFFLWLLVISLIWGSSFILIKYAALAYSPVGMAFFRVLFGAVVLRLLWLIRQRAAAYPKGKTANLLLLAMVGYFAPFLLQPYLIERHGSGYISLAVCFIPLFTIFLSIPMLKKLPNRYEVIGVTGGLIFLCLLFKDGFNRHIPFFHLLLWLLIPLCYATGNTLVKMKLQHIPPLIVSCLALSFTGLLLLPFMFRGSPIQANHGFLQATGYLLILGFVSTGLMTALFYRIIFRKGPLAAGMVSYMVPAVAILWSWLDGEAVTPMQLAALAGVLLMVGISQIQPVKKPVRILRKS